MRKLWRTAGWLVSLIGFLTSLVVIFLLVILVFAGPLAHWAVEKYGPRYIGRQIALRDLHIGVLSGNIRMEGFRMMELNPRDTFFYLGDLQMHLSLRKMIGGVYQIDSVRIDSLFAAIDQRGSSFNFDDLLARFATPDTLPEESPSDTVKYFVGPVTATNISLIYRNAVPKATLRLHQATLNVNPIQWDKPLVSLHSTTRVNAQGILSAGIVYNMVTSDYQLDLTADSISTAPAFPWIEVFLNAQRADGLISSRLKLAGNAANPTAIAAKGTVTFDEFILTDNANEKQAGWKRFSVEIDSLNTTANLYRFNNVLLREPYLLVTLSRDGNNLSALIRQSQETSAETQTLEGAEGTPLEYANPFIQFAEMVGIIAKHYSRNEYGMKQFAVENGTVVYNDFLTQEKFSVLFQELSLRSSSFTDASKKVAFNISTLMNRYGNVTAHLEVDNQNYRDFDLSLTINSLTMSVFNPYTKYYVAHPFWRGDISFSNTLSVKEGNLKSNNHLIIKQIKVGDKIRSDSAISIPVKLAVAILRDRKGNIDLEIPIDGKLNDPNYHWGKAALKIIGNLLVKAVTAPWDFLSRAIGGNPDDLKRVEFDPLQDTLRQEQLRNLNAIGKVLSAKPDLKATFTFRSNIPIERDDAASRIALTRWNETLKLSPDTTLSQMARRREPSGIDPADTLFRKWLMAHTTSSNQHAPLPELCLKAIGGIAVADALLHQINHRRDSLVRRYLVSRFQLPDDALIIEHTADEGLNRNTPRPTYDVGFESR